MKKINGKKVSEEQVDGWVAEAEEGYDVEFLRQRGRPTRAGSVSRVVPVRMTDAEIQKLDDAAEIRNLSRSAAIREALHGWLGA